MTLGSGATTAGPRLGLLLAALTTPGRSSALLGKKDPGLGAASLT